MKLLRDLSPQLALAGIVALQISCGDSSGPGSTAAAIAANSSTTLTAAPGGPVAELPSVVVSDQSGNPLGGVHVTFAVATGGGSVTGGNAISNSSGVATVGSWTLGTTPGSNTLTATTGSLPAILFTAQGADPCLPTATHTVGSTTNAQLSVADCRLSNGTFVDFYRVTIPAAGTYVFTQTSTAFDAVLAFLNTDFSVLGVNDDIDPAGNFNSRIKILMPAGDFLLAANSFDAGATGNYTLSSNASTAEVSNCEDAFVMGGTSSAQSLQTTDCVRNGIYADEYVIFLKAAQTIIVSMSSSAVDSYLEIFADGTSTVLASNDNIDGTTQNARVPFTAGSTGAFYIIRARSTAAGVTGSYTLGIQ